MFRSPENERRRAADEHGRRRGRAGSRPTPRVARTFAAAVAVAWVATAPVAAARAAEDGVPFSHDAWSAVLDRFVDDRGNVDYDGLARDRDDLDRYVATIAATGPKTAPRAFPTDDHALAYYLNAYNALVFAAVLDAREALSKSDDPSVWRLGAIPGYRFFVRTKHTLEGGAISLRALENDVIRRRFEDPRIHAALNCASRGCPRLPRVPFSAERLDDELDAAMREFVSEDRAVSVDHDRRTVFLSKIFDWFRSDFVDHERALGADAPSLVGYVNRFRTDDTRVPTDYRVRFAEYDRSLNDG